jgi:hypothetical protein
MMIPGYSLPDVEKNFLRSLKVEGIDKLYPGADKVPPLPNPKAALEQLKLQGKQMELDNEKQMFIIELQSNQKKVMAEIAKLEAESIALLSGVQDSQAATQIKGFDLALNAMKMHNEMIMQQIKSAQGGQKDGKPDGGSVPGMESGSGNAGASTAPPGVGAGAQGAMGAGAV